MSVEGFLAGISPYMPIIMLFSYVLSPLLALASFIWNRKDRRKLIAQAEALGHLKCEIAQARALVNQKQEEVGAARRSLEIKSEEIEKLQRDLHNITEGSQELWKLRPAKIFADYLSWIRDPVGAKLITIGNLKGGVGKTTLAANLAAYISHTRSKPVLLVDLDYQGSLSNMLLLAAGREEVESRVDWLFEETANLATVDRAAIHLVPKLSQAWLVPANYTFARVENHLLLKWLLEQEAGLDVRYRLAHALLQPEVRRRYAAIIFDMPPRMTLGSINALVASHYFVVPTVLDGLSIEAVGQFLTNMQAIKSDLSLDIELAGIAGMMTRALALSATEARALDLARDSGSIWRESTDFVFQATLPRRVDIANAAGEDIAYFGADANGPLANLFDPLFEEICSAVWRGQGP